MNYRRLGRTALQVSELCLGTMNFGPRTSQDESFAILDDAIEAGINFVDTANQYGGSLGVGATETIVGKWLAADPSRREKLVLATKVYEPMSDDVNDRGLSARHIVQACEASLKRLNTDCIDLYQMHHFDRVAPLEETWQAMDLLIQQGKIRYVGSSNFPGWMIAKTNENASFNRRLGLISEQSKFSLLERRIELEVLPACRAFGVGVIAWSPLAGGVLAGGSETSASRRASNKIKQESLEHNTALEGFDKLCKTMDQPPSVIALSWILHQPGITAVAIGPGTRMQLASALSVPAVKLSKAVLEQLDALFPPCGEAPEAYAW